MVLSAMAAPPGPVVSWPTKPRRSATSSSMTRPWSPPTLIAEKTKAASVNASSGSPVTLTMPGWPRAAASSTASLAVVSRRNGSGSNRLISSKRLAPPDNNARTKAGMRTPPPPNIASFTVDAPFLGRASSQNGHLARGAQPGYRLRARGVPGGDRLQETRPAHQGPDHRPGECVACTCAVPRHDILEAFGDLC